MKFRALYSTVAVLCLVAAAHAAVPSQITVQGKLTDALGNPLPAGSKTFVFRVFNAQNAGTELWPGGPGEVQFISTDAAGLWSANLGSQTALTAAVFAGPEAWLEVTVNDGQAVTTLPRTRLVTSAYSHRVATVDGASGGRLASGLDFPFNGSTLNNNVSGLRWMNGTDIQSAFGFDVFYGLHFQGSFDTLNREFGVRAPTADGSLGQVVFSVDRLGKVTARRLDSSGDIYTGGDIIADGDLYSGAGVFNGFLLVDGHVYLENAQNLTWISAQGIEIPVLTLWSDNNVYLDANAAPGSNLIFRTNPTTERMRIASSGNVGIGTNNPGEKVHVVGNIYATGTLCGINVCPSDARFKQNVTPIDNPLGTVERLRGVNYEWKREEFPDREFAEGEQVGLIAQDVQKVVPQAVHEMSDGYLGVDYARLVPLLIESIKEQQKQIDELKARLDRQTP